MHETAGMVRTAADCGVDCLELNPTYSFPAEILVNKANAHRFRAAQLEAENEAARLGVRLDITRPLDLGLAQ